jgi:hypothetical protein
MGQQKKSTGQQPAVRQYQAGRRPATTSSAAGASSGPAPAPSAARRRFTAASAPVLLWMHGMPRWIVPVVMGLLLAGGLFLSGSWAWLGTVFLAIVGLFLLWLFLLAWPVLTPTGRLVRALAVVAVAGLAVLKATGRL